MTSRSTPPRHLATLFLIALLGVLGLVGVVAFELGGWPATVVFAVSAVVLLALGTGRARASAAAAVAPTHACTCCSTDHSAPARTT